MELDLLTILRAKALLGVLLFSVAQICFGLLVVFAFLEGEALGILIASSIVAQGIGVFGLRIRHQARQRASSLGLAGDPGY